MYTVEIRPDNNKWTARDSFKTLDEVKTFANNTIEAAKQYRDIAPKKITVSIWRVPANDGIDPVSPDKIIEVAC